MSPVIKIAIVGIGGGIAIGVLAAASVPSTPIGNIPAEYSDDQAAHNQAQTADDTLRYDEGRYDNGPPSPDAAPAPPPPADWSDAGTSPRGDVDDTYANPPGADDDLAPVDDRAAQAADAAREAADDARAAETAPR